MSRVLQIFASDPQTPVAPDLGPHPERFLEWRCEWHLAEGRPLSAAEIEADRERLGALLAGDFHDGSEDLSFFVEQVFLYANRAGLDLTSSFEVRVQDCQEATVEASASVRSLFELSWVDRAFVDRKGRRLCVPGYAWWNHGEVLVLTRAFLGGDSLQPRTQPSAVYGAAAALDAARATGRGVVLRGC